MKTETTEGSSGGSGGGVVATTVAAVKRHKVKAIVYVTIGLAILLIFAGF